VPATFPITSFQLAIAFAIFGVIFGALAIILAAYFLKHPRHDQINSDIAAMKGDMVTIKEDINAIRGEIPSITTELKNINQTLKKMSGSNNNEL